MKTHPVLFSLPLVATLLSLPATAQQITGWGLNVQGQAAVPPAVVEPVRVAGGTLHSTALLRDGSVVAWGTDVNGSLAAPAGLSGVIQLECAYYTNYALKSDGTVTAWGDNWWTQRDLPPWLGKTVVLAAGGNHAMALNTEGLVVTWGSNAEAQLDVPPAVQRRTLQIAAGGYHSLAISESGTVTAWGGNANGQATVPAGLGVCRAVAGGLSHTLALKADGTVAAWGLNSSGQCNVPAGLTNVVAIAAGYWHSTALRVDGTVVAWGFNAYGQGSAPAGLSAAAAVESSGSHSLALTSDASRAPDIISAARALTTATATQFHYRAAALHSPVTWSIAGALPAGMAFNAATGVLSGTTAAGTYNIQLQAANGFGTDTHTLQLTVINNALPSLPRPWMRRSFPCGRTPGGAHPPRPSRTTPWTMHGARHCPASIHNRVLAATPAAPQRSCTPGCAARRV